MKEKKEKERKNYEKKKKKEERKKILEGHYHLYSIKRLPHFLVCCFQGIVFMKEFPKILRFPF
jgi:hypothetical protein